MLTADANFMRSRSLAMKRLSLTKGIYCLGAALLLLLFASLSSRCQEFSALHVSAATAYSEPHPDAFAIDSHGVVHWTEANDQLVWYGKFTTPGKLTLRLKVALSAPGTATYRLTVGKQTLTGKAEGVASHSPVVVAFGTVDIAAPGPQRIALQCIERSDQASQEIYGLELSGSAAQNARFTTVPQQRGAPSVHLR